MLIFPYAVCESLFVDMFLNAAVKNVFWSAAERFSAQGVQFLLNIIIARIVLPEEFGIMAIVSIFVTIAQVFVDGGFSNALIQKKNRTIDDFNTVFCFNILISLFLYVLLFLSAPLISSFYNKEVLVLVIRLVGLNLIISSFSIVQRAKLTIDLDFKLLTKVSLISAVVSGIIAIMIAYAGGGVWSLVIQSLIANLLLVLLLYIKVNWHIRLMLKWGSFKQLFSFGSKLLLSNLLHTIYLNLYSLIIGRFFSATSVGYYNMASKIAQFPSTNFSSIIARALYPVQCEMQDEDKKLSSNFHLYIRFSAYVIFPFMVVLIVLAEPIVISVLTEKWSAMIPFMQIISLSYIFYPIQLMNGNILNVKGRSDYYLKSEILKKIIALFILFITIFWGVKAMCYGLVVYNIIDLIIIIYFSKKVINTGYIKQFEILVPIFLLNICLAGILFITYSFLGGFLGLVIAILLGGIFYLFGTYIFSFKEYMLFKEYFL